MLRHDVVVVGAGLAGMRAAIEAKRAGADVAIVSKLHPTRSHSGSAEGGINAALGNAAEDSPEIHTFDTDQGLGLPGRPGRDRDHVHRGARRHLRARAHGRGLLALRRRPHRAAPLRRRRLAAHRLLGRHHGPRADPRALRAAREVRGAGLRGVLRDRPRGRRRPLRRRARLGHRQRRRARASPRTTRSSPPAASGACTTARRTPTPARATACRWRGARACRSRTWSSCSSTRRR